MPKLDKTGPTGKGPMTGCGYGVCAGYGPCFGPGMGMGWRRGFGMGRGWRRRMGCWTCPFCLSTQPIDPKDQKEALSDYKNELLRELKVVEEQEKQLTKK